MNGCSALGNADALRLVLRCDTLRADIEAFAVAAKLLLQKSGSFAQPVVFLEIGAVSFGGGYGMISIIREKVLTFGWLSEDEFVNFIAVSESTPGPLAVNMATFVGSSQAGFVGGLIATLGVVLPSFVIIFIIASIMKDLLKYSGVKAMLSGIRPCVVAMILATGITMVLSSLLNITTINSKPAFDYKALIIFLLIALADVLLLKLKKFKLSPITIIVSSAFLGIIFY